MRLILVVVAGSLVVAIPALGCGTCSSFNGNPLALPHPQAIEIAVATRSALDQGVLGQQQFEARASANGWNLKALPASGLVALQAWLEKKKAGKATADRNTASLHIVLIDTSEIVAVHFRSGAVVLESRPQGSPDTVVATTTHGLRALLSGELSFEDTVKMKLAVIEGRQALANALVP